jgi:glycosyltransferase involved in cell wall biosynthesis
VESNGTIFETLRTTEPVGAGVSVVVPAYNSSRELRECLSALVQSIPPAREIIVVDDASTDDTSAVAASHAVVLVQLARNSGPAAARNAGSRAARGDIVFFVDADVVVAPDAIARVVRAFAADPGLAAVFGSYDRCPRAPGLVSQYRNLLHHYVHQTGNPEASTFWAGCGAIRRSVFLDIGGFDAERFPRCIEDIELGQRLYAAGHRIRLDRDLQGTHLKQWRLLSVIRTDVTCRALPWARLILTSRTAANDLNLRLDQRVSAGLVGLAGILFVVSPLRAGLLGLAAVALAGVLFLNRRLFAFLRRERGLRFALACVPLHLLYFLYSGLSYGYVWVAFQLGAILPARGDAVAVDRPPRRPGGRR